MFYKPNFCCNCGEKIQRAEWKLLSSRRFCDVCGIENQGHEWLPRAVVGVGLVLGIFGFGSLFGARNTDQAIPMRLSQTVTGQPEVPRPASRPDVQQTGPAASSATTSATLPSLTQVPAAKEQPRLQNSASDEPVYFCGALTKKGKPCSRRVKAKGRCWQHTGQDALEQTRQLDVY